MIHAEVLPEAFVCRHQFKKSPTLPYRTLQSGTKRRPFSPKLVTRRWLFSQNRDWGKISTKWKHKITTDSFRHSIIKTSQDNHFPFNWDLPYDRQTLSLSLLTPGEGYQLSSLYCRCVLVAQSCLTLCHPMDCSPPGSSVHGILQARILEWVAISFSRETSQPRNWTQVSRIAGKYFTDWAIWEAQPRDQIWVFQIAGRFFTIWATSKPFYYKGSIQMLMKYFPSSEKK